MEMTFYGDKLLKMSREKNQHTFSLKVRLSYPTVVRYLKPSGVKIVDLDSLAVMLSEGCGLNVEQIQNMKIGDLFSVEEK